MGCTASYCITFSSRLAGEVSQLIGCSCSRPTLNHVASDCLYSKHHQISLCILTMCCSSRAVTSFTQECVAKSWLLPDKEKAAGLCARFFAAVFCSTKQYYVAAECNGSCGFVTGGLHVCWSELAPAAHVRDINMS